MSKSGYSRSGLFGTINHYDSHGHKIGESRPGIFGSYDTASYARVYHDDD